MATLAAFATTAALLMAPPLPAAAPQVAQPAAPVTPGHPDNMFVTSHECTACHNGLTTRGGEDVSIGLSWRASMMANASRDPYWQAGVRREVMDHPAATAAIEDECSICHMPMSRTKAHAAGEHAGIFAHLPIAAATTVDDRLAADGVSCTACHQIAPDRLGTADSFSGAFVIAPAASEGRRMFGPFAIEPKTASVMRSATAMTPAEGSHVRDSALCATCHTLYTQALGSNGEVLGRLPEQTPYLEWQHSAYARERSCQACHMPTVTEPIRITSVLGEPRENLARHTFLGGNFFMLRMLNRYRNELGVEALPQELEAAATATLAQLRDQTASVSIESAARQRDRLAIEVRVRNLTGHKLPTAYPSRRAWLHLTVRDRDDRVIFSSGGVEPSGLIRGNDYDADAARVEPHHQEITSEDQVQIYESVMHEVDGRLTTALLRATGYAKDNRLLPRGFDKGAAPPDIGVIGAARDDVDFDEAGDRVRYTVAMAGREGPFRIDAELRYQPISFRWAQNLRAYDALETRRFVSWFDTMSSGSSALLASARAAVP